MYWQMNWKVNFYGTTRAFWLEERLARVAVGCVVKTVKHDRVSYIHCNVVSGSFGGEKSWDLVQIKGIMQME
jgi:hypothetical protein